MDVFKRLGVALFLLQGANALPALALSSPIELIKDKLPKQTQETILGSDRVKKAIRAALDAEMEGRSLPLLQEQIKALEEKNRQNDFPSKKSQFKEARDDLVQFWKEHPIDPKLVKGSDFETDIPNLPTRLNDEKQWGINFDNGTLNDETFYEILSYYRAILLRADPLEMKDNGYTLIDRFYKNMDAVQKAIPAVLNKELAEKKEQLNRLRQTQRRLNFRYAQTLSAGMNEAIYKIDDLVSANGGNESGAEIEAYKLAFRVMMLRLEEFENDLTQKANNDSTAIYEQVDSETATTRFKEFIKNTASDAAEFLMEEAMGRPNKVQLFVDYNWARYGKLALSKIPSRITSGIKDVFNQGLESTLKQIGGAAKGIVTAEFWSNALTGNQEDSLRARLLALGDAGKFAVNDPLIISEIASNLRLTQRLLENADGSILSNLKNDMSSVLSVATTKHMVIDALLGDRLYWFSKQDSPRLPESLLRLYGIAWWAPYVAGGYLGATGKSLPGQLIKMMPFFGEALTKIFGGAAGVAWTYAMKVAASNTSRRAEIWANSLQSAIETFANQNNPLEALKAASKYALSRELLKQAGNVVQDLNNGEFIKNIIVDNIKCIPNNPKAAAAGAVSGGLITTLAVGATATAAVAAAPLALGVAGSVGGCWVIAKIWDKVKDGPDKRRAERVRKAIERIDQKLTNGTAQNEIMAQVTKLFDEAEKAEMAKEFANDPDFKLLKAQVKKEPKNERITIAYYNKLFSLYENKLNERLREKEAQRVHEIAAKVKAVPNLLDDLSNANTRTFEILEEIKALFETLQKESSLSAQEKSERGERVNNYLTEFGKKIGQQMDVTYVTKAIKDMKEYLTILEIDQIVRMAAEKLPKIETPADAETLEKDGLTEHPKAAE